MLSLQFEGEGNVGFDRDRSAFGLFDTFPMLGRLQIGMMQNIIKERGNNPWASKMFIDVDTEADICHFKVIRGGV